MDPSARSNCEELLEHPYFDVFREEIKEQQPPMPSHHHRPHRRRGRRNQVVTQGAHKNFNHFPVSLMCCVACGAHALLAARFVHYLSSALHEQTVAYTSRPSMSLVRTWRLAVQISHVCVVFIFSINLFLKETVVTAVKWTASLQRCMCVCTFHAPGREYMAGILLSHCIDFAVDS